MAVAKKRYLIGLKACRIRSKIGTQEDAAKALHVPHGTYRNWEQCISTPQETEKMFELCDLFDCSIDELYGRHTHGSFPAEPKDPDAYPIDLSSLNEAGRQSVRLLVDLLEGGDLELYNSKLPELMTLINRSLAQRRGDGGGRSVSAEAV